MHVLYIIHSNPAYAAPIPPKQRPLRPVPRNSASSEKCHPSYSLHDIFLSQDEAATEERDFTGDSGIETGSGTTKYGTIEEWKESIQNPPPGMYISLVEQTHFEEGIYILFYRYS